jgi:hypothetical protein
MNHQKLLWICTIISALCLSAAYAREARYEGILVVIGSLVLHWLFCKRGLPWLPSLILVGYTITASAGLLIGLSPWMLLVGISTAVGSWEAALFMQRVKGDCHIVYFKSMESKHLQLLSWVILLSLLLGFSGLFIHLDFSFFQVVLSVLAALLGLNRLAVLVQDN